MKQRFFFTEKNFLINLLSRDRCRSWSSRDADCSKTGRTCCWWKRPPLLLQRSGTLTPMKKKKRQRKIGGSSSSNEPANQPLESEISFFYFVGGASLSVLTCARGQLSRCARAQSSKKARTSCLKASAHKRHELKDRAFQLEILTRIGCFIEYNFSRKFSKMRQPVGFKANFPSASIFTQDTFSFEMLQRLTPKTENQSGELFLRNIIFVFFAIRAKHTYFLRKYAKNKT